MQEPLSIPRFIALVTEQPLEQEVIRAWFSCVKQHAPSGVLLNIPTSDDKGMPKTVCMVHREQGNQHRYMVPLARDLAENEGDSIVDAFGDLHPDLDFDVQSSATHGDDTKDNPPVIVDQARYVALCTAWAKRQHDTWMKDREENGWRYGTTFSMKDKTNPLIMPWEQLPEKYRKIDLDEPQALLDLLNDQGYAVVTKGELEAMLNLMRVSNPLLREGAEGGSKNMGRAIAYAMHAVKKAQGADRAELSRTVSFFNAARTLWKLGDHQGAHNALQKGIALLDALSPIEEDFFKKKSAPVPADRLHHYAQSPEDRLASRDWNPYNPDALSGTARRDAAQRDLHGGSQSAPQAAPAVPAAAPGFGKRLAAPSMAPAPGGAPAPRPFGRRGA